MNESSCCSTSSPAFDVVGVLDFSHSNSCAVGICFNLHFHDKGGGASFHVLITICLSSLSVQVFCPFFNELFVFLLLSLFLCMVLGSVLISFFYM